MKTKRRWQIVLKRLLLVALAVLEIAVAYNVIHNRIATDDVTIQQDYEAIQEKHEFLKEIARDAIEEGNGIEIDQLSRKGIQYKIYNNGENIIIHYYIDEKIGDEYPYEATITLSNEYEILDEQYVEKESFEAYKWRMQILAKMGALAGALMTFMALYLVCCVVQGAYYVVKWAIGHVKKQKSKRNNKNS